MRVTSPPNSTTRIEKSKPASGQFNESLVTAFERTVETFPSRIAVSSGSFQATYRQLNETANRFAHQLLGHGLGLGGRVAILMAHDGPMIAALLGVSKAGQIVVALDPNDPVARLKMLVEDAQPSVIVTDENNRERAFALAGCPTLIFDAEAIRQPANNPAIEIPPEQPAFLVYTSGTTGRPKGVMRSHRQFCRGAAAHTDALQVSEFDRIPLFASLSTGQGLAVLACTLLNGAMLCPFSMKLEGVTRLLTWMRELTVWFSSASIFRTILKSIDDQQLFSNFHSVLLATESASADEFRAFQKHFSSNSGFVHTLASSEAILIAFHRWTWNDNVPEGVLPVGNFAKEMDILLVGENGEPVAPGEIGEIVLKSRYLANGYWRDPELTSQRFSADLDGSGTRLFWTGDLGRMNERGMLEVRGRKDDRIKIRGYRIEVGEIERCLERLSGVARAAVVALTRTNNEPILAAFVKVTDKSWTADRLRQAVREKLPIHMTPSWIIILNELPYRGNKIDRQALREYRPER